MLQPRSLAVVAALIASAGPFAGQTPASPAPADVIQIDVRVVDGRGAPVTGLLAAEFEVTVEGSRRPVLSAEYQTENATQKSSVVVVADQENLRRTTSRLTLDAAAQFIEQLPSP